MEYPGLFDSVPSIDINGNPCFLDNLKEQDSIYRKKSNEEIEREEKNKRLRKERLRLKEMKREADIEKRLNERGIYQTEMFV